jgi:hypothetical protein
MARGRLIAIDKSPGILIIDIVKVGGESNAKAFLT